MGYASSRLVSLFLSPSACEVEWKKARICLTNARMRLTVESVVINVSRSFFYASLPRVKSLRNDDDDEDDFPANDEAYARARDISSQSI